MNPTKSTRVYVKPITVTNEAVKEDGDVNALGAMPTGSLTAPSPARKKGLKRFKTQSKKSESIVGRLLQDMSILEIESPVAEPTAPAPDAVDPSAPQGDDQDAEQNVDGYTELKVKGELADDKLTQIVMAIAQLEMTDAVILYSKDEKTFYIQANADDLSKIKEVIIATGVEFEGEPEAEEPKDEPTPSTMDKPNAQDPASNSTQNNVPAAMSASNEDESELPVGDEEDVLTNGRFANLMYTLTTKIERKPVAKQAEHWKALALELAKAGEGKASIPLYAAAKAYLKAFA